MYPDQIRARINQIMSDDGSSLQITSAFDTLRSIAGNVNQSLSLTNVKPIDSANLSNQLITMQ